MKKAQTALNYFILLVMALVSVFPLWFMVVSCFNESKDILAGRLLPGNHFLDNFQKLIGETIFIDSLINSIKYTIIGTAASVLICALAGYAFEVYHDKEKDRVMTT